jgi:AcrR family transcriptional regulator
MEPTDHSHSTARGIAVPNQPSRSPSARKQPQQARSRITVEALLEATAQVLTAVGYDELTTARIAERAGVSIGTLYQYVPGKDALVAALVRDHLEREAAALTQAFGEAHTLPLADAVERLVRAYVGVSATDPARTAALIAASPHVGWDEGIGAVAAQAVEAVQALLEARPEQTAARDARTAAFVVATSVHALVQRAAAERPGALASGRIAQEAAVLARCYLIPDA